MNQGFALSNKLSEILAQDVSVLNGMFGVKSVGFLRIYFDQSFFYSCSDKSLILDYCHYIKSTKLFFKEELFFSNQKECIILWPDKPDHYSMDLYIKHGYWNGITWFYKEEKYVELWWVTRDVVSAVFEGADTKILCKYIDCLKIRCSSYLTQIKPEVLFFFKEGFDLVSIKSIGSGGFNVSEREYMCLELINKGYSLKQIALSLNLSVNTVNTYVMRLKQKLNVNYKSELIEIFNRNLVLK